MILCWINLPIIDQNNQDHSMSQKLERQYIDPKDPSIEDLLKTLPKPKEDTKEKEAIANAKTKDKKFSFAASKDRSIVRCDSC